MRCFQGLFFACVAAGATPTLSAQVVQGRVIEATSSEGVPSARIELLSAPDHEAVVIDVLGDAEGRFRVHAPSTGTYRLRVSRIGYETVTTDDFDLLSGGAPLEVAVLMAVEAVPLAPFRILSERPARLNLRLHTRGYYDRKGTWGREGMGFGHFLDGEQLDRLNAFLLTDAVKDLRGVRVEGGGRRQIITLRGIHGARCIPTVFVNGAPIATGADIDQIVAFPDLAAIEVYPGLTMPGEFMRGDSCGVVVVWTGPRLGAPIRDLVEAAENTRPDVSLELRIGPGIGDFAPVGSGLHWAPRAGGRATVDWRVLRRIAAYGGISRTAFGCERGLCRELDLSFVSRGVVLGLRGDLEIAGGPWLQLGVTRHRLRWTVRGVDDVSEDSSAAALGVESAAGFRIRLGERASVTPGVRFVRYTVPEEVRLLAAEVGLRWNF